MVTSSLPWSRRLPNKRQRAVTDELFRYPLALAPVPARVRRCSSPGYTGTREREAACRRNGPRPRIEPSSLRGPPGGIGLAGSRCYSAGGGGDGRPANPKWTAPPLETTSPVVLRAAAPTAPTHGRARGREAHQHAYPQPKDRQLRRREASIIHSTVA